MGVFSMSARGPSSAVDAYYLQWHALDHLPEQYRLKGIRLGSRWVSTPACRAARAYDAGEFAAIDHVVNYLISEPLEDTLDKFFDLRVALVDEGRMATLLPSVHAGHYRVTGKKAAARAVAGAHILPWRPARGIYLLIEKVASADAWQAEALDALTEMDGVVGVWRYAGGVPPGPKRVGSAPDMRIAVFYLDAPPVEMARPLGEALATRWRDGRITPLLAAPLEVVVPWQWERHLP
jgi:hypothetical protein